MLSQGHMVAPSYRDTSQVGPRFGNSVSLVEWKWCHNLMVVADIHLRSLHTSILDIYTVFELLRCCLKAIWLHPYTVTPGKLALDLGSRGHVWSEKWCHNVLVEADIHLRPLHTSILDIHKVFEPLVCCLEGMWLHPYAVTLVKLVPDLGIHGPLLWIENITIMSLLRLIYTLDHFIHPY